jgi:hypothetical protein
MGERRDFGADTPAVAEDRLPERQVSLAQSLPATPAPILKRRGGNITKHFPADVLRRKAEHRANVPVGKRRLATVGDNPVMGVEIQFAFDRPGRTAKAAQVPTSLGQDAGGEGALCFGES